VMLFRNTVLAGRGSRGSRGSRSSDHEGGAGTPEAPGGRGRGTLRGSR
jgi:hypothetical protein